MPYADRSTYGICCVGTKNTVFIRVRDKKQIAIGMRWLLVCAALAATLGLFAPSVVAFDCPGGEMTITPSDVLVLSGPATFSIVFNYSSSANFPNILLVMTKPSCEGLTGPIFVNWTGGSTSFVKANFQIADDRYIPSPMITSYDSGRYGLSELREHLGVNDTANEVLYYVFGPFLSGAVGRTAQTFNVTLPSENPRMLVLAIARTVCSTSFDIRALLISPIIPEFNPVLLGLVLGALGFCLVKAKIDSRSKKRAALTSAHALTN